MILITVMGKSVEISDFMNVVGFYIISYFIGYIMPGAPGGIGIRETVLILLLTSIIGVDRATSVSILHRLVTIIADVMLFSANKYCISSING